MRNAFSLDFKREVDVALCILRFQCIESIWNPEILHQNTYS